MAMTSPLSPYEVSPITPEERPTVARSSSSNWPGPGIFVKMDFGVSFSPHYSKRLSFGYASRNIDESIMASHPLPATVQGDRNTGQGTASSGVARTLRRGIRSRSALQLRTSPVSPLSASPSAEPQFQDFSRDYRSSPGTPSTYHPASGYYTPQIQSQSGTSSTKSRLPYTAVRQTTIDRRPLPPLPTYRLGQDLPWTSPTTTWTLLDNGEPTCDVTDNIVATPVQKKVEEDPQRTRELAELNEAMMAVDLGDDRWHPRGMWERRPPGGPRDLGWAIAVPTGDEARAGTTREIGGGVSRNGNRNNGYDTDGESHEDPPPAYSAGQWGWDWEWVERGSYWIRSRPRRRNTYYYA